MIEGFDILNEAINDYIIGANITGIEDLDFLNALNNIILNSKEVYFDYKSAKKYSLKESDKLVKEFLDYLNPYYREYYEKRVEDGTIIFDTNVKEDCYAFSSYDPINKKRIIYIPVYYNLHDSYAIIHELMHDINMDVNMESLARFFYTEGMSLLAELLYKDFLKEKNIKQYEQPINRTFYELKSKAIEVDFNIKLIDKYLKDGYIDVDNIVDILDNYPNNYASTLQEITDKIMYEEKLTLDQEQPYIIGGLIATYMYDRIKNNKTNILELFELNQMLKHYNYSQVLEYLDFDIEDGNITKKSFKQLEEKYKKYLKSR